MWIAVAGVTIAEIGLIPLAKIKETVPEDGHWTEAVSDDAIL